MKQLIFLFLIVSNSHNLEFVSKEKKILGEWTIIKTLSIEKIRDNLYSERSSGLIENMNVNFKTNNIATVLNKEGKFVADLFWKIDHGKIQINYNGDNSFLQNLNGKFEIKFSGKKKLELVGENNISIFFER